MAYCTIVSDEMVSLGRWVGSQKHRLRTQVQVGRVNSVLWRPVYMYMFYYDLGSCDLIWGASAAGTRRKSQL